MKNYDFVVIWLKLLNMSAAFLRSSNDGLHQGVSNISKCERSIGPSMEPGPPSIHMQMSRVQA